MSELTQEDQKLVEICCKGTADAQQRQREEAMAELRSRYTGAVVEELTGWSHMTIARFCRVAKEASILQRLNDMETK